MGQTTRRLMMGAAGAAGGATFVDDVFSTYLYKGNSTARSIVNGIDLAGEGGMVWTKNRASSYFSHRLFDTERGIRKMVTSNTDAAESANSQTLTAYNSDGFSIGTDSMVNSGNEDASSWTFRKAPGFFDVVTYTGTGVTQNIAHNLGSVPGAIFVKRLDAAHNWGVYHRGLNGGVAPEKFRERLNIAGTQDGNNDNGASYWANTAPTSTHFTVSGQVGSYINTNISGASYVAYLFAGGASTAATARSVAFSSTGANDGAKNLTIASSSGTNFGSGDFTMECWFKDTRTNEFSGLDTIFSMSGYTTSSSGNSFSIYRGIGGFLMFNRTGGGFDTLFNSQTSINNLGQWHHFAWTRSGSGTNNNKIWLDGNLHAQFTRNVNYTDGQNFYIGGNDYNGTGTPDEYGFNGKISNVRLIKGQAIYTTNFKPSNEPFTTTSQGATASNVKVICCNNSSITGSSVTSGTITATNAPTASTDVPFDDLEGFKFGADEDQNIIKTGSFIGNGSSSSNVEINLGWEPSFVIIKNNSTAVDWRMLDSMRGITDIPSGGDADDAILAPSNMGSEASFGANAMALTPRGFKLQNNGDAYNQSGANFIYIAVRRPDGYVGKPAEAGTNVFAMDTGNTNAEQAFTSGFPVDWAFYKKFGTTSAWYPHSRLTRAKYMHFDNVNAEQNNAWAVWDDQTGWAENTHYDSDYQSWMFKRHAGFDVVNYIGNQTSSHKIAHSLGRTPEMIWTKNRDQDQQWSVGHKDLNGGTNPWNYLIVLNDVESETQNTGMWEAPTATHFTVGSDARVNKNNLNYLGILFSSVEGICKVGSYTGSSSALTITTGFQPRFVIIKNVVNNAYNSTTGWFVFDTTRGWSSGNNDKWIQLNSTAAQTTQDWTDPTSTGFTINADSGNNLNNNGDRYIYYAHA